MKNLLYLVHRLPYPPNKGDKITSYNMLKYLSARFNVYLGCFVDDLQDWQYVSEVEKYCTDLCAVGLKPAVAKLSSLKGLVTGEPLTLPYYRNSQLQGWVDRLLEEERIDSILVLSGAMAQYVSPRLDGSMQAVLDLEDVDSDKWQLFASNHDWPLDWVFRRESRKLLAYERQMAAKFGTALFVSQQEAELFRRLAPEVAHKVEFRVQGVNCDYFDPSLAFENPYGEDDKVLVFTGAMDYWPNTDAVAWFAKDIMPRIREAVPEACFYIVGMNPVQKVRALAKQPSVTVTGGVPDVRPYLAHATAAALPLRVARGIQNKILEAMAMEIPVLATPEAIHGIEICPEFSPMISDSADGLAEKAITLLTTEASVSARGRNCVLERYDWERNLRFIYELLSGDQTRLESQSPTPALYREKRAG